MRMTEPLVERVADNLECRCGGMVDTGDSKSPAERRVGSNPTICTNLLLTIKAYTV
jgi:hypothetical protein